MSRNVHFWLLRSFPEHFSILLESIINVFHTRTSSCRARGCETVKFCLQWLYSFLLRWISDYRTWAIFSRDGYRCISQNSKLCYNIFAKLSVCSVFSKKIRICFNLMAWWVGFPTMKVQESECRKVKTCVKERIARRLCAVMSQRVSNIIYLIRCWLNSLVLITPSPLHPIAIPSSPNPFPLAPHPLYLTLISLPRNFLIENRLNKSCP